MSVNKVVYGTTVLVDLTEDTVTSDTLVSGTTAHDKSGTKINGGLVLNKIYSGSSDPSSSLGNNGDIYIKI